MNPNYDAAVKEFDKNWLENRWNTERAAGDTVTVHPDGSVSSKRNLAEQRKREALAKIGSNS